MSDSSVLLVHHAAKGQHNYPPNSIRALQACLDARARIIEMDISLLADGEFVLLHGPTLERDTTGSGPVSAHTAGQVSSLRFVWEGLETDEPLSLLGPAAELLYDHPLPIELQLDLKAYAPFTDAVLSRLIRTLQPVKDRVRVSSMADWALRRLRALDADLLLGFDPLLYLDANADEARDPSVPPFRLGAFGYWDSHPLASRRWGGTGGYLAARAEALWNQAPAGAVWYIASSLLAQALDDGFDWIADLHRRGVQVAAWTLDPDRPEQAALAKRLVSKGIDRIISNDAQALAPALGASATYDRTGSQQ